MSSPPEHVRKRFIAITNTVAALPMQQKREFYNYIRNGDTSCNHVMTALGLSLGEISMALLAHEELAAQGGGADKT